MWIWIYTAGEREFRYHTADEETGLAKAYMLASVTEKPVTVRRQRVIPTHPPIVSEVTIATVTPPEAMCGYDTLSPRSRSLFGDSVSYPHTRPSCRR